MPQRRAVLGWFAVGLVPRAAAAQAEAAWPTRPIRLIVPFSPAGSSDTVGRMLAERLSRGLPQPVVVENRAGLAGTIGVDVAAKSPPDGYTFVLVTANQAINETLQPRRPYRLLTDLVPVAAIDRFPLALAIANRLPPQTLADFIVYARANPGTLSYGSSGPGSIYHLTAERLRVAGGFEMQHVPYRNYGEARTALIAGQIQLMFDATFTLAPLIRAGQVRGLATTGAVRAAQLPELPTLGETLPGFEASLWNGMLGPAGLPASIIQRMNAAVNRILADPEMQAAQAAMGTTGTPMSPADFGAFLAAEVSAQADAVRLAGVQPE
jgi:tripartite-type tricarboxylate transporter receptor subunit TctC